MRGSMELKIGVIKNMEAITKYMFKAFEHVDNSDNNVDGEINTLIRLLKKMKNFPRLET